MLSNTGGLNQFLKAAGSQRLVVKEVYSKDENQKWTQSYGTFECGAAALSQFLKKHESSAIVLTYLVARRLMDIEWEELELKTGSNCLIISLIAQLVDSLLKRGYSTEMLFLANRKCNFNYVKKEPKKLQELFRRLLKLLRITDKVYIITDIDMSVEDWDSKAAVLDLLDISLNLGGEVTVKVFITIPKQVSKVEGKLECIKIPDDEMAGPMHLQRVYETWSRALE